MKPTARLTAVTLAALVAAFTLLAADKKPEKKAAPAGEKKQEMKHEASHETMSAEDKAMMDAWMKASTPGDHHKKLAGLEGTWNTNVKMWMKPGAPPEESTGTSENKMVLGGRYLQQSYSGSMMGGPFNGIGYTAYDNIKNEFVSTWIDSAGTGIMVSKGNLMEMSGTVDDPVTGKPLAVKEKLTIADADHHSFEMWMPAPDGSMFKTMEIWYTRK